MKKVQVALPGVVMDWLWECDIVADVENRTGAEKEWMEAVLKANDDPDAHETRGRGTRVRFELSPDAASAMADELDERRETEMGIPSADRAIRPQRLELTVEQIRAAIKEAGE